MKRLIVKSLEVIALVLIVVIVLGAAISGAAAGGFIGFLGGLVFGAIMGVLVLGTLFLIMDIADNTRRMVELLENQNSSQP